MNVKSGMALRLLSLATEPLVGPTMNGTTFTDAKIELS